MVEKLQVNIRIGEKTKDNYIMATKGYDFRIEEKDEGYVFRLYPNNNKHQPIGESAIVFLNEAQCRRGLSVFRQIITESKMENILNIDKVSDTQFYPYLKEKDVIFRRTIALAHADWECKQWATEIWDNIDAPLVD